MRPRPAPHAERSPSQRRPRLAGRSHSRRRAVVPLCSVPHEPAGKGRVELAGLSRRCTRSIRDRPRRQGVGLFAQRLAPRLFRSARQKFRGTTRAVPVPRCRRRPARKFHRVLQLCRMLPAVFCSSGRVHFLRGHRSSAVRAVRRGPPRKAVAVGGGRRRCKPANLPPQRRSLRLPGQRKHGRAKRVQQRRQPVHQRLLQVCARR